MRRMPHDCDGGNPAPPPQLAVGGVSRSSGGGGGAAGWSWRAPVAGREPFCPVDDDAASWDWAT